MTDFHMFLDFHHVLGGPNQTSESNTAFIHLTIVQHNLQVQCEQYSAQGVLPHLPCEYLQFHSLNSILTLTSWEG